MNHVYFISDAHFGIKLSEDEQRESLFFEFIKTIPSSATLFIVGDLFDFWIEYKWAIRPDYFLVLHKLMELKERGVEIHYLAGNHDFALGKFLSDNLGITIHSNFFEGIIQDKKIYIYHGDGLIKKDVGYRILKKVLRNPLNQRLYKLLHPNIGVPLGVFFSGSSRKYLRKVISEERLSAYHSCARKVIDKGYDIVIFGHTHHAELLTNGTTAYCNTGSWLINYNYATLQDGSLRLWRYHNQAFSEEIFPSSWK